MQYFSNFPLISYKFDVGGAQKYITVKDIALNVRVRKYVLSNIQLYDEYDIEDRETPDQISYTLYGKPDYHWVIMLLNGIFHAERDFPKTEAELLEHISHKYGPDSGADQHVLENGNLHYEDEFGIVQTKLTIEQFRARHPIVNESDTAALSRYNKHYMNLTAISNHVYEDRVNEAKRRIKVLNQNSVERTAMELRALINYG